MPEMIPRSRTDTSLSRTEDPNDVYWALERHQVRAEWEFRGLLAELQRWVGIIALEFKLQIPEVSLQVDDLPRARLGHFRYGCNGFGLRGEIAINRKHLTNLEPWELIGILLHELIHGLQQVEGKWGRRNYHNVGFRAKASELGLIVDARGYQTYAPNSPFIDLLNRYGVFVPELPQPVPRIAGQSKLKKWSCGCTNVRVAVDLSARCLRCGNIFLRCD